MVIVRTYAIEIELFKKFKDTAETKCIKMSKIISKLIENWMVEQEEKQPPIRLKRRQRS